MPALTVGSDGEPRADARGAVPLGAATNQLHVGRQDARADSHRRRRAWMDQSHVTSDNG